MSKKVQNKEKQQEKNDKADDMYSNLYYLSALLSSLCIDMGKIPILTHNLVQNNGFNTASLTIRANRKLFSSNKFIKFVNNSLHNKQTANKAQYLSIDDLNAIMPNYNFTLFSDDYLQLLLDEVNNTYKLINTDEYYNSLKNTDYYGEKGFISPNNENQEGNLTNVSLSQRKTIEKKVINFIRNASKQCQILSDKYITLSNFQKEVKSIYDESLKQKKKIEQTEMSQQEELSNSLE